MSSVEEIVSIECVPILVKCARAFHPEPNKTLYYIETDKVHTIQGKLGNHANRKILKGLFSLN